MKKSPLTRRSFLASSTCAALTTGFAAGAGCKSEASDKRAVVVGSGFAGAVAALRLGEAGIATTLVERGRRWSYEGPDSFPTIASATSGDGRSTWLGEVDAPSGRVPVDRYTGMMERVAGDTVDAVCGAGLGGGSLVYGGVLLQPRREFFEQVFPHISYDEMASTYFPRVLERVSGGPIPDAILNAPNYTAKRAFIEAATAGGLEVTRGHVGFDWGVIQQELDGALPPAASIGEYVFSCNSGAKKTLDRNYIREAEETGMVEVRTLHEVVTVTPREGGGYVVHCNVLAMDGSVVEQAALECDLLFLAAGSINTTKLLLKAKARGDLPGVNAQVGLDWAANGDELMAVAGVMQDLGPVQGGPPSIAAWDLNNSLEPVGFMHSPSNAREGAPPTQMQLGMCVSDALGHLSYDAASDAVFIHWPLADNRTSQDARLEGLQKIAANSGGQVLQNQDLGRPTMWHPLGGAVMGSAVDADTGELIGQADLFVIDSAVMPGSTAIANPSLTVAANAERMLENLLSKLG